MFVDFTQLLSTELFSFFKLIYLLSISRLVVLCLAHKAIQFIKLINKQVQITIICFVANLPDKVFEFKSVLFLFLFSAFFSSKIWQQ